MSQGFSDGSVGKESAWNPGDRGAAGSIPGWGRSCGGGNGNPLQYSCLGNSMHRGAQWGTVHGMAKSQTRLRAHACALLRKRRRQIIEEACQQRGGGMRSRAQLEGLTLEKRRAVTASFPCKDTVIRQQSISREKNFIRH